MKPLFIIGLFLSTFISSVNAQLTKGSWLVGGAATFSSSKDYGNVSANQTINSYQASPNIGYFFMKKLAAGLQLNITSQNDIESNGVSRYSIRQTTYGVGPFVRYYFLPIEKQLNLFVEGGDIFRRATDAGYPSQNSNTYFFLAGPAFYFNEHVGLEFTVGFTHTKYANISSANSEIQVGFGLQIHLKSGV